VVEDCGIANDNTDKEGQEAGHERANKVTGETEADSNKVVAIYSAIAVLDTQHLNTIKFLIAILQFKIV
jgi:ABC-type enterochelin transport system substrate-binding protein